MAVQTYWLERSGWGVPTLSAYTSHDEVPCPAHEYGHWGHARLPRQAEADYDSKALWADLATPWPTTCDYCGAVFNDGIWYRSSGFEHLYCRKDTGEELLLRDVTPGALYFAPWLDRIFTPQREHCINVVLPDGSTWTIDSCANNCPFKDTDYSQQAHHCWVIEPDSDLDHLTVSKNGVTCAAGAGSILTSQWHGFLRNGLLVE